MSYCTVLLLYSHCLQEFKWAVYSARSRTDQGDYLSRRLKFSPLVSFGDTPAVMCLSPLRSESLKDIAYAFPSSKYLSTPLLPGMFSQKCHVFMNQEVAWSSLGCGGGQCGSCWFPSIAQEKLGNTNTSRKTGSFCFQRTLPHDLSHLSLNLVAFPCALSLES